MKAYLLSIPAQLAKLSHAMDVSAVLANKSWSVFNDEGIKQVFIFHPDGKLIISTAGKVVYSTWNYQDANQSIIIENGEDIRMFHPAFSDDVLLVLQQDGTQESVVMIDEKNAAAFAPKSLQELKEYFIKKELALLQAQKEERRRIYGPSPEEIAEQEQQRKAEREQAISLIEKVLSENVNDICPALEKKYTMKKVAITGLLITVIFFIILMLIAIFEEISEEFFGLSLFVGFILVIVYIFLLGSANDSVPDLVIEAIQKQEITLSKYQLGFIRSSALEIVKKLRKQEAPQKQL